MKKLSSQMEKVEPKGINFAILAWQALLGKDRVLLEKEANFKYSVNTLCIQRMIAAALVARTSTEIIEIVKIANKYQTPLYPISTGRNWGYGSAMPVVDHCVILDLSKMNKILDIDPLLGLLTIEPGVTQGQLSQYLHERQYPFMVPTTGAGPSCSLVGNALERGYGSAPYQDHFTAVTSIEAVLPSGELYQGSLTQMGGTIVDRTYKWGVGPYLDGLFSQGNFGIVTSMTIKLVRIHEELEIFTFNFRTIDEMLAAIGPIRETIQTIGENVKGISLMNGCKALALTTTSGYLDCKGFFNEYLFKENLELLLKKHDLPAWIVGGAIYGTKEVTAAVKKVIKRKLNKHIKKMIFINYKKINFLNSIVSHLPWLKTSSFQKKIQKLKKLFELSSGIPNETMLRLPYWKMNSFTKTSEQLNPDQDECGLIWFTSLVPLQANDIKKYISIVTNVCLEHQIEPIITLVILGGYLQSNVALLFDTNNNESIQRAHHCYQALFKQCKAHGYLPYRLNVEYMKDFTDQNHSFWELAKKIKLAIDPNNIIAPGRYQKL